MDQGLKIGVSADVQEVVAGMQQAEQSIQELEKELNLLGRAIDNAISKGENIAPLEEAFDTLNTKIKALRAQAEQPIVVPPAPPIPVPDDTGFLNSLTKQRIAFTDLGRIITGQGFSLRSLASNFSLLGPGITIAVAALYGLYEVLNKQTDAEKKAEEEAKKLHDTLLNLKDAGDVTLAATGSEEGNIARVQALAAAVQDSNKTYAERKHALDELRETNKAYFGDLTLEASSLKTLSARVTEYSQALITEAIVKGQVDEIAKVSAEYEKQAHVLDILRDAKTRADAEAAKPQASSAGNVAGGGADVVNNQAARAAQKANDAFNAQRDAVEKLSTAIATYKGALNQAIAQQIDFKPLKDAAPQKDDLKSIIPILEQIKKIYEEISKPSKEPIFKLFADSQDVNGLNVIRAQISEAIKKGAIDGANDPELARAYADLATALQAKLAHVQNPDLRSHVNFTLADPTKNDQTEIESKLEKVFGSKGLELKIPVHLSEVIDSTEGLTPDDLRKIEEVLKKDAGLAKLYVEAPVNVQLKMNEAILRESNLKILKDMVKKLKADVLQAGFQDIGIAIGDALSGAKNPLQKAIQDFTTVLGDGLIKIGEQMIIASSVMSLLKKALRSLFANPAGGIIEGIAAVAVGEVIKNVGAHAFATGGIVTGPTYGLVGEAGPEVIFPLDRLNRFIKGNTGSGPQNIVVTGKISGRDIAITQKRDAKLQNLTS